MRAVGAFKESATGKFATRFIRSKPPRHDARAPDYASRLPPFRNPNLASSDMLARSFRKASRGLGEYCPMKNELRVRKGRKVYRFTCRECELRFAAPGQEELVIHIAPDATVPELRKGMASLIESR